MKKLFSYLIIFIIGISAGILVRQKLNNQEQEPIFHTATESLNNVSTNDLSSIKLRQVSSQQLNDSRRNVITEAVKHVSPAVVGINVLQIRQYRSPLFDDPFFQYFLQISRNEEIRYL